MNHTCLCLPSWRWYSFTDPGGMEGWVGLGWLAGWLHTEISVRHWELNPETVANLSTNRARRKINFVDRSQRANHYTPDHQRGWGSEHALVSKGCSKICTKPTNNLYTVSPKCSPFYFYGNFPNWKPIQRIFGINIAEKIWNRLTCGNSSTYSLCVASLHRKLIPTFLSIL